MEDFSVLPTILLFVPVTRSCYELSFAAYWNTLVVVSGVSSGFFMAVCDKLARM